MKIVWYNVWERTPKFSNQARVPASVKKLNLFKSIKISKCQSPKIRTVVATLLSSVDGQTCLVVKMLDKISICIPYYKPRMNFSMYLMDGKSYVLIQSIFSFMCSTFLYFCYNKYTWFYLCCFNSCFLLFPCYFKKFCMVLLIFVVFT